MPLLRVVLVLFLIVLSGTGRPAAAGAFLIPEGEGQFIAGVGYVEATRAFTPGGQTAVAPSYRKAEASGYLEYGLTSSVDLIVAPTLGHTYGLPAANSVTGSDSSAIGARVGLYGASGRAVSVQVLLQPPIGPRPGQASGVDARLMFGRGFEIDGWPAFVDIEPGLRARPDDYPNEARLEIAGGIRFVPNVQLLVQDFNVLQTSSRPSAPRQAYSKAQCSVVFDLSRDWSVQVGGFHTVAGRNTIQENGPFVALWRRFQP